MPRQTILDIAKAEVGTLETPPNSKLTKYGAWYGINGVAWCAIFVSWVYDRAGYPLGNIDTPKGYHYCPSAYNHWKISGELTNTPQPGDIVLYDWNGDGICDHTGIFNGWTNGNQIFEAYEGNTALKNDSNGGQVMLRTRQCELVAAFVSPKVLGNLQSPLLQNYNLSLGSMSAGVVQLQKALYNLHYNVSVDGNFGAGTQAAVEQFQKDNGLQVTGVVTPAVLGAIEHNTAAPTANPVGFSSATGIYLQSGANGSSVVALQKALNVKGANPPVAEDGVFGMATLTALKAFQASKGLLADGVAGPATFNALGIANA